MLLDILKEQKKTTRKKKIFFDSATGGAMALNFIKKIFFTHNICFFGDSSKNLSDLDSACASFPKYEFSRKSELKSGLGS